MAKNHIFIKYASKDNYFYTLQLRYRKYPYITLPVPTVNAIPACIAICLPEKANPVLMGRYTGMDVIKCVILFVADIPNSHIGPSTFTQNTGRRNNTRDMISARNGVLHLAEIPKVIPTKRRIPKNPRKVINSRRPPAVLGQYP